MGEEASLHSGQRAESVHRRRALKEPEAVGHMAWEQCLDGPTNPHKVRLEN